MKLSSKPISIQTALVSVGDRLTEVDHLPDNFVGVAYIGRHKFPNVMIEDLGKPLGFKINELIFDEYTLHGIIPIFYDETTNITECIIDYFTTSVLVDVENIALSSNGKTTDSESVN